MLANYFISNRPVDFNALVLLSIFYLVRYKRNFSLELVALMPLRVDLVLVGVQRDLMALSQLSVSFLLLQDALVFLLFLAQLVEVLLFVFAFVLNNFFVFLLQHIEFVAETVLLDRQ